MTAGSSGEDNDAERAPAQDPRSRPFDFSPPGPAASPSGQPPPPAQAAPPAEPGQAGPPSFEPGGFASQAPSAWSAPAEWTSSSSSPPPWPGQDDAARRQAAGSTVSPAGADPWSAQPATSPPAGQSGPPPAGQYTPPSGGQHGPQAAGQYAPPPPGQYGYPAAGAYGYQSPYYAPTVAPTNPVAIAALVCGIAQLLGFVVLLGNILLAIPAVICGSIALRQIRARGGRGRGMAIAGLVLGIVGIVIFVLFLGLLILGLAFARRSSG